MGSWDAEAVFLGLPRRNGSTSSTQVNHNPDVGRNTHHHVFSGIGN